MHLRGHGGLNWLCVGVSLLACAASAARAVGRGNAYMADAPAAKAFCASPEFKSLQCGWASERERKLTGSNQCDGWPTVGGDKVWCATDVQLVPEKLPAKIGQQTGSRYIRALSLACKGPIVVRAVFKLLTPAPAGNKVAVRLRNDPLGTFVSSDGRTAPSEVVRCKLQLPAGAEPEEARALKGKEVDCVECRASDCPAAVGTWYRWVALRLAVLGDWGRPRTQPREKHTLSPCSHTPPPRSDTYTSNAIGCGNFAGGYHMRFEELNVGVAGGDDPVLIQLAKFEVCDNARCFDAKYEAAKAKSAAAAPKAG
jgi:hypothetical protein